MKVVKISVTKLVSSIFSCLKSSSKIFEYIDFFNEEMTNSENNKFMEIEFLQILISLIYDKFKNPIENIQRKILAHLLRNNKHIDSIIKSNSYLDLLDKYKIKNSMNGLLKN